MVFTRGLKTLHILKIGSALIAVRIRGYKIWLNDLLIFQEVGVFLKAVSLCARKKGFKENQKFQITEKECITHFF